MKRRSLEDLPFRSCWMRARQAPGTETNGDAEKVPHRAHTSASHSPTPARDPHVAEAFAAYDVDDVLRCIELAETCLRGLSAVQVPASASGTHAASFAMSLPPIDETCALFHEALRSYLSLRRPREARRLGESWDRYLAFHTAGNAGEGCASSGSSGGSGSSDGGGPAALVAPAALAWRAVHTADMAECLEYAGDWEAAGELLAKAETDALQAATLSSEARSPPSSSSGQRTEGSHLSSRDHCRLVLRRLTAQTRHALSRLAASALNSHSHSRGGHRGGGGGGGDGGDGHRSLFALGGNTAQPVTTEPLLSTQSIADEVASVLAALSAEIPTPEVGVEWADVWVLSRRCAVDLLQLEAGAQPSLPLAVLKAQRRVLVSTLDEVRHAWRRLSLELCALSSRAATTSPLEYASAHHSNNNNNNTAAPLAVHTLSKAAKDIAQRRAQSDVGRLSFLRVAARRLLEEWCLLALDCLTVDLAIVAVQRTEVAQDDEKNVDLSVCWTETYEGEWALAELLTRSSSARPWPARHLEMALRAAHLLFTTAAVQRSACAWFPRCGALQSERVFTCLLTVAQTQTRRASPHSGDPSEATSSSLSPSSSSSVRHTKSACELVAQVAEALPHAPFTLYRQRSAHLTTDTDVHHIHAYLAHLQGAAAECEGRTQEAIALYERALHAWVESAVAARLTGDDGEAPTPTHTPTHTRTRTDSTRGAQVSGVQGRAETRTTHAPASSRSTALPTAHRPTQSSALRPLSSEALCAMVPRGELWERLRTLAHDGMGQRLLLSVIALVRCLLGVQRLPMAVQLLQRMETLFRSVEDTHASKSGGRTTTHGGACPTPCTVLRLVRATLLCCDGALNEASQLCHDVLCDVETPSPAAADTAAAMVLPVTLRHGDASLLLAMSAQLPFWCPVTARSHALHVWATACVRAQRWTEATALARRLVCAASGHHSISATRVSLAPSPGSPSPLMQHALVALGWVLVDTGHAKEARQCAARACHRPREAVQSRRTVKAPSSRSSQWCESAALRDADYLHACAVRLSHTDAHTS